MSSQMLSLHLDQIPRHFLVSSTFSASSLKKSRMDEKSLSQYVRSNRNPSSSPGTFPWQRHMKSEYQSNAWWSGTRVDNEDG